MHRHIFVLSLIVFVAACGESTTAGADGGTGGPDGAVGQSAATVFAVGTDYATGGIASTIAVPSLVASTNVAAGVASTDPVVRKQGDYVFIVNRFGSDNVTILKAADNTLVAQISTGAGSNPQDVAADGDKLYVAALNSPGVLVLDMSRPNDGVISSIDLGSLDSVDGKPNCNALAIAEGKLYVVCGILDDNDDWLPPRGPGKVAVINLTDDSIETSFELTNAGPYGLLRLTSPTSSYSGDLLVNTVDFADLTVGCLERIQVGTDPQSAGCAVTNAELGGYAGGYAFGKAGTLWVAVVEGFDPDDFGSIGKLVTVNQAGVSAPISPPTERVFDVTYCPSGHVVVSDAAGGLRVYDESGAELTSDPIDIGMPVVGNGIVCY